MALTDDQRAMLRLLAQREEGYEDIAALKGIGVEEVKAEVREALAELAAEQGADRRPPAAREGEPVEPEQPPPPAVEVGPPPPPPSPARATSPRKPVLRAPGGSVPPERRRFLALAGGAVGAVAVALIAIALIGGGSGSSSSGSAEGGGPASEVAGAENGKPTQAELQPVGGESGAGRAVFGRVGKEEIVLQVTARDLEPNPGSESYTVWLYRSPKVSLRVGAVKVGRSGRLGAQFPIPAELLAYVAAGAFRQIYVSRTADAAYEREVARAKRQKKLPPYTGETVLRGEITGPIVKSASPGS